MGSNPTLFNHLFDIFASALFAVVPRPRAEGEKEIGLGWVGEKSDSEWETGATGAWRKPWQGPV